MKKITVLLGIIGMIFLNILPTITPPDVYSQSSDFYSPADFERNRALLPDLSSATPAETAITLVELILYGDEATANIAGMELLRRAGIPLVSPEGPMIAMPDNIVLAEAALYADLIPQLVMQTRRSDTYTTTQLVELIFAMELTGDVLPVETFVIGLGQYGKSSEEFVESQIAGAAIRALSASRQEVLYAGANYEELHFDVMQTMLILAQLTNSYVEEPTSRIPAASVLSPFYQETDGCTALKQYLEGEPFAEQSGQGVNAGDKHGVIEGIRGGLIGFTTGAVFGDEELGGKYATKIDRVTKGLNMLLLLMGVQLDLFTDKASTHFKHTAGSETHVNLTAIARFDSALAQKRLACYELAGLSVPPNGFLSGYKVRWNMDQPLSSRVQEGGKFLTTISADSHKIATCGTCGEVTNSDGRSTLELFPKMEKEPGIGAELTGQVTVYASLDKADFPFKLSDFFDMAGFAATKLYDLAVNAMTRAGLPSQNLQIEVSYHGSEIFKVSGESKVLLGIPAGIAALILPVKVDMYTCTGLQGPWHGVAGMPEWDLIMADDIAEKFGYSIPPNFSAINENMDVTIPITTIGTYVFDINGFLFGEMTIDWDPGSEVRNSQHLGEVGTLDVLLGEESLDATCQMFGCSVRYPIVGVNSDPRCGTEEDRYEWFER